MRVKCLISDLDGTLFDTEAANWIAYECAFLEFGYVVRKVDYQRAFGLRFDAMVKVVAPHFPPHLLPALRQTKAKYYSRSLDQIQPNVLLIDFLRAAKDIVPIGLATTASRVNAEMLLEYFSVSNLFDSTIFGEDVECGKPDPACFNLCIAKCAVLPNDCVIFEDSEIGMQAAAASGAKAIFAPAKGRNPLDKFGL